MVSVNCVCEVDLFSLLWQAQDFTGSNNIPLLQPHGQFGTRHYGGKDAASPRYIHTSLSPLARKIFRPEDDGMCTSGLIANRCLPLSFLHPNYFSSVPFVRCDCFRLKKS